MIQHIAIRRPEYVAGTKDRPEVKIFMETHAQRSPIDTTRIQPNQIVWMKWSGGPIVAKSRILSWHRGRIENGNINDARQQTIGTNLFGLDDYWRAVQKKQNVNYVIVRLTDEEWLEQLIYPLVRSHGSAWIILDSDEKRKDWLHNLSPPVVKKEGQRSIPAGLRFEVLRRDDFTCRYCGRKPPDVELHVDHIIPWSIGRKHELDNLVTSCQDCNLGKSNKIL